MQCVTVRNVNHALVELKDLLVHNGQEGPSRNGPVVELNEPVAIEITNPTERCLFWPQRRWNPFFAFHEAMWIMAGRSDLKWLLQYNREMQRWSDNGVDFNAPYGHRMRNHDMACGGFELKQYDEKADQIRETINLLKADSHTRQAVIQIWDYRFDGPFKRTLDRACNMLVVFSMRSKELRMTVINRSNDLLLGFCNVNHVQFSILHEYVARNVGARIGPYTHFSNCMHAYTEDPRWDKLEDYVCDDKYVFELDITPLIHKRKMWDHELQDYMRNGGRMYYTEPWFNDVMAPLDRAWWHHKKREYGLAQEQANLISSEDIRIAATTWLREIERIWRSK